MVIQSKIVYSLKYNTVYKYRNTVGIINTAN